MEPINTAQFIPVINNNCVEVGSGHIAIVKAMTRILIRLNSNNPFHANDIIWSILNLGKVALNHINIAITPIHFAKNQNSPGIGRNDGSLHPDK